MSEPVNHESFINAAKEFKRQLQAADFTPGEIEAMLGSLVQNFYMQTFQATYPPEFHEMMTKQNLINERMLAEEDAEDA